MINNEIKEIKLKNMNNLAEYRKVLYENPKLRNIFIEVTLNCNANCEHCGSRCGSGKQEEEIDAKYLKKAFDSIAKKYNTKEILLSITGGEPLLRKDLFEIMDYAKKLGFQWGMTSNGMLITDNIKCVLVDNCQFLSEKDAEDLFFIANLLDIRVIA